MEILETIDSDTDEEIFDIGPETLATANRNVEVTEAHQENIPKRNSTEISFTSRERAITREPQVCLDGRSAPVQNKELHALRMEGEKLKIKELKIQVEMVELRKKIMEEQLEQEKLKTKLLKKTCNKGN